MASCSGPHVLLVSTQQDGGVARAEPVGVPERARALRAESRA